MKTNIQKLFLALAWLALPLLAQAQFTFTTNNGAITITGYTGSGGAVVIPATTNGYPVTSIGDDAFEFKTLGSVTIPDSVTNIEDYAFNTCHSLTRVTIGNSVVSIGIEAFNDCSRLTSVTIPNSVTNIGDLAFSECAHLTSETIPNSVTSIGDDAFSECSSLTNVIIDNSVTSLREFSECVRLTSVTIGNTVTSIGDETFEYCSALTSVTIPNSVTNIGEAASSVDTAGPFQFCTSLTNVIIGNSVTAIGNGAFSDCSNLTSLTISSSVTSIGNFAFYGSAITNLSIPSRVTNIEDYAFECASLTSINVDTANPAYSSLNGVLFDKAQVTLLQFPEGLGGSYAIPNSVTNIGRAFEDCSILTSVSIPTSVTSVGDVAFANCTSLTAAYFQGNAPPDDGSAFTGYPANDPAIVYYLAGTTGWGSTFGGVPAVLWNPQAIKPGFTGGNFGFNLTGPTNAVIVVEACTNLSNPVWLAVATNTFSANGTSIFSDPSSQSSRFYRFRSP